MKTIIYSCLIITLSLLAYTCSHPGQPTVLRINTLKGTYISEDNPFYKIVTFKNNSDVEITSELGELFGISQVVSYKKEGKHVRITADGYTMLLFEIVDKDTLRGEGFARGTYVRQKR